MGLRSSPAAWKMGKRTFSPIRRALVYGTLVLHSCDTAEPARLEG